MPGPSSPAPSPAPRRSKSTSRLGRYAPVGRYAIDYAGLVFLGLALAAAFYGWGDTPAERLHAERLAAVAAALAVLWTRPLRPPRFNAPTAICLGLAVVWFALASSDVMGAQVQAAAFEHWQRSLTGLFLFYAACVFARRGIARVLVALSIIHLLLFLPLAFLGIRPWNEPPLWTTAAWVFFVPGLGFLLGAMAASGKVRLSDMERRWRTAVLLLLLAAVALVGARVQFRAWSLDAASWPIFNPRQASAPALAARTLALHPMRGVGAGSFVERLEALGVHPLGDRSLRRPAPGAPLPEILTGLGEEAVREFSTRGQASRPLFPRRRGLDPRLLNAWRLLLVERGLLVTGLAVVIVLFIAGRLAGAIILAPRARPAFQGFVILVLWAGLLLEGFLSLTPAHPYGVLLAWVLAGAAWGAGQRLRYGAQRQRGLLAHCFRPEATANNLSPKTRGASLSVLQKPDWVFVGATFLLAVALVLHTSRTLRSERLAARLEVEFQSDDPNLTRWRSLAARHPLSARFRLGLGRAFAVEWSFTPADEGLAHRAERALRQAIALNPCRPEAYAALAAWYEMQNDFSVARGVILKGLVECPQSLLLMLWRAQLGRAAGEPREFAAAWREAIPLASGPEYDPALRVALLRYLAQDYERRGLPEQSLGAHYALLQLRPRDEASLEALHDLARFAVGLR